MKRFVMAALAVTALAGMANTVDMTDAGAQEFRSINGFGHNIANPEVPTVLAQLNRQGLQKVAPKGNTGGGGGLPGGAPGGYQTPQPQCLTGFSRTQLQHMGPGSGSYVGHLQRMTCLTPVIQCPKPSMPGVTVGIQVNKQLVNADDGRFRIEYKCEYYTTSG